MSIRQLQKRASQLVVPSREDPVEAHWRTRIEQRTRLLVYFMTCVPESRGQLVFDLLVLHLNRLCQPWNSLGEQAPSLARWIACLDTPGGSLPPTIPESLIDLYLEHPTAQVLWWDCGSCGVFVPGQGGQPLVQQCPVCGGTIGWQAYRHQHGVYLPSLAAQLPDVGSILKGARA